MKIAIVGKGRVGKALAPAFQQAGHNVVYGVRDPTDRKHQGDDMIPLKSTAEAIVWGDVIIAAIMWDGINDLISAGGDMSGKILIDCINPYDFAGGLKPLIDGNTSTAELIQARTKAAVVKTLNQVGSDVMADLGAHPSRPLQFVAADDADAKGTALRLLLDIGFDGRDAGGLEFAADLEGMARLWIAQAFMHGMDARAAWLLTNRPAS